MEFIVDKVRIDKRIAQILMNSEVPCLLAGSKHNREIRIIGALPIEEGTYIGKLEECLRHTHFYPIEPGSGEEVFGTCPSCNVSGNYPLLILKENKTLNAYIRTSRADNYRTQLDPVKTEITSF